MMERGREELEKKKAREEARHPKPQGKAPSSNYSSVGVCWPPPSAKTKKGTACRGESDRAKTTKEGEGG